MTATNARKLFSASTRSLLAGMLAACVMSSANATEYKLYFLGGQSNMEGYGYTAELDEEHQQTSGNVMIFAGQMAFGNDLKGGAGIWAPLRPGYGTGFTTDGETNNYSNRFGPELLFGQTLAADPDANIAIIKYAAGGTGLSEGTGYGNWYPDQADGGSINQYDHALRALRNALSHTDIDGDGVADTLIPAGIVWMQGEADAHASQAAADAYRDNIKRLMDLFRAAMRVDDLPVVIGKITDSGMAEDGTVMDYITTVQRAQRDFVDSDTCAAYVTITDDISHLPDAWHYDTDGFVRLGTAFADAMMELEKQCGFTE